MMDIETARTIVSYAYALVLISLAMDVVMRVFVKSDKLHNRFLTFMDKYGWFWYLLALCAVNDRVLPDRAWRVYLLVAVSIFSLVVSWYRYKEIIPKVRANNKTMEKVND